jgi:hypothetical protein
MNPEDLSEALSKLALDNKSSSNKVVHLDMKKNVKVKPESPQPMDLSSIDNKSAQMLYQETAKTIPRNIPRAAFDSNESVVHLRSDRVKKLTVAVVDGENLYYVGNEDFLKILSECVDVVFVVHKRTSLNHALKTIINPGGISNLIYLRVLHGRTNDHGEKSTDDAFALRIVHDLLRAGCEKVILFTDDSFKSMRGDDGSVVIGLPSKVFVDYELASSVEGLFNFDSYFEPSYSFNMKVLRVGTAVSRRFFCRKRCW